MQKSLFLELFFSSRLPITETSFPLEILEFVPVSILVHYRHQEDSATLKLQQSTFTELKLHLSQFLVSQLVHSFVPIVSIVLVLSDYHVALSAERFWLFPHVSFFHTIS